MSAPDDLKTTFLSAAYLRICFSQRKLVFRLIIHHSKFGHFVLEWLYRSAIFYFDDDQKQIAGTIKATTQNSSEKPIVTEITQAMEFYKAEDYHQKYTERTGRGMCHVPYKEV
ncbi:peptide-methionine (S)-S-oxide reductase [Candidatus Saccharibacteria bacterium]|nr:peptide-methionine (S)-S-oxide reductase [Candidatus Saccharibacteria bacterium]MBI3338411.1 peptide-methionine (S)-S-oxide reductase [Candidatus Saccharibacteria bacterium]